MTGSEADWTVITVSFNNSSTLKRCWGGTDLARIRWIVVDNGSTDGSADVARELGADVISLEANLGFSKANNIGLASVSTEYVAFVNPDVFLNSVDLLELARLSSDHDALIAPQLVNLDRTIQSNARGLPFLFDKFSHRGVRLPGANLGRYIPHMTTTSYAAWVIGAAVTGKTDIFRHLGGWDESFFLYHEDSSLCLKAWECGYHVILCADRTWVHEWKRDSKSLRWRPIFHEAISAWKFYRKYPVLLLPNIGPLPAALRRARDLTGKPIETDRQNEEAAKEPKER